ncbi:protein GVQW3-like [Halyomorpha halys]|uniref:protein GVQW3-like n=1 Tax=Halyomorpha halys TaxID=286706 RepID=UPI0006D4ECF2|nr:uncharacterized protein LOC106691041 [Halyomorpha halys]
MPTFRTHRGTLLLHIQLLQSGQFKFDRENLDDDPRSGRPKSAMTLEFIAKVLKKVMEYRRLKVREIAKAVEMSSEQVSHILTEELEMKTLSARWVPRLLTLEHKRTRFLHQYVTTDET